MALVAYSDSEGSDDEHVAPPAPSSAQPGVTHKAQAGNKIKVEVPRFRAEPAHDDGASPPRAKRARTSGAFSGFNDLLPAPKRAVTQASGVRKGVSLKTSAEAAFTRAAPPVSEGRGEEEGQEGGSGNAGERSEYDEFGNRRAGTAGRVGTGEAVKTDHEVTMVGRATRFRPLSVANHRRKAVKKKAAIPSGVEPAGAVTGPEVAGPVEAVAPAAKPKRSLLFSVQQDEVEAVEEAADDAETPTHLQPEEEATPPASAHHPAPNPASTHHPAPTPAATSLDAVASDLNLSAAERRQLLGRQRKGGHAGHVTHFNLDTEYRANEQLRQAGDTVDHKAVKAIAPGKHSLQQLVNNARSHHDGIQDKWAEGRRARGEGGSKYGWAT